MRKIRRIDRIATILTLFAILLVACNNTTVNTNPGGHASSALATTSITTVALVTDVGEQNSDGFNQLAHAGYLRAQQQYGFPSLVLTATTPNDYVADLNTAAEKADMVIVVGFLMQTPLDKVARAFPSKKFAMVDGCAVPDPNTGDCENLSNVVSLLFNEQEAGCVVGALAAQMEIDGQTKAPKLLGKNTIGAVGSQPIPSVDQYITGYKYCAKTVDPKINVVVGYTNNFTDPATCQALAENQITERQADILFQVANTCGLGVLNAATAHHVYSIGVDTDQSKDASGQTRLSVITSALKRVDTAVYSIITDTEDNQYNAFVQKPLIFDVAHDGISFASPNPDVPQDAINKAKEYEYELQTGVLTLPT
ncbi:MAG: BMP family lipoprotein [Ktedonobacteraceae bacterium]